ncbi:MAG: hypothetical protein M0042_12970 [Nitrospiraceae bacterium]|nr:hypothetical protein [Nitrospiraceae bacterium]
MKVDCYLSEYCASQAELDKRLSAALKALHLQAEIVYHTITYDDAVALQIPGSPTIRIDGRDLYPLIADPAVT